MSSMESSGQHSRVALSQTPPLAPSAAYAKRARELQAEDRLATARYLPPALRNQLPNAGLPVTDDRTLTYNPIEQISLPANKYAEGFRRARAGTLPSNVQLAAQRYAAASPGLRSLTGSTESFSDQFHASANTTALPTNMSPARPLLRHAVSTASALPSTLNDRNSRLRSGSLTLPQTGLSNSPFGPGLFSSSVLTSMNYSVGFSTVDERSPESGMDDYDVHTLDYLGLDDGQRHTPAATFFELRNQAQAVIAGNLASNPPRIRSSTVSNPNPRMSRSSATLLSPRATEEEAEYFDDFESSYERRRMEDENYSPMFVAKGFRQGEHLLNNAGLRPRATSVGNGIEEPTRPFQRRLTIAEPMNSYMASMGAPPGLASQEQRQALLGMPVAPTRSTSPKIETASPSQVQTPTRSLWIGNLDSSVTSEQLIHVFAKYGAIESLRLLPEKECGFVNFMDQNDAVRAKDDVLNRLGGLIGMANNQAVRIGFGKAENELGTKSSALNASVLGAMDTQMQATPTRALWIGSIPSTTTPAAILSVFSPYGPIESARVLTHKNCGFINFERLDDAVRARKALNGRDILGSDVGAIRIGFAKVPVKNGPDVEDASPPLPQGVGNLSIAETIQALRVIKGAASVPVDEQVMSGMVENYRSNLLMSMIASGQYQAMKSKIDEMNATLGLAGTPDITEQQMIMFQLSAGQPDADDMQVLALSNLRQPAMYYTTIPPVSDRPQNRRWDASKLRDLRKKLDMSNMSIEEIDAIAKDLLDGEVIDLASDWLGNTVVQKLFERCSPLPRYAMLECICSHLATIGIHKNGTWAAQKIIECVQTPEEVALITQNLRPFVPPLLLDQFGNYVVQCCLRFGSPKTDFIYDAMVDRIWEIAQGRFGARSMRTCLEKSPPAQQRRIATAIILNSIPLATNPNGALLLTWLLDTTSFPSRYILLAPRFIPHLSHLCTHKLASVTVLRLINQNIESDASAAIIEALFMSTADFVLLDVLADQINGVALVHKVLTSPFLDPNRRPLYIEATKRVLFQLKVTATQAYRRLIEEVGIPVSGGPLTFADGPMMSDRTTMSAPVMSSAYQHGMDVPLSSFMGSMSLQHRPLPPSRSQHESSYGYDQGFTNPYNQNNGIQSSNSRIHSSQGGPSESFRPFGTQRVLDMPMSNIRPTPLRRSPSGTSMNSASGTLHHSNSTPTLHGIGNGSNQTPPWERSHSPIAPAQQYPPYVYHPSYPNSGNMGL